MRRIREAGAIALVLADAPGLDAIGSAVALEHGLQKIGKAVSVFASTPERDALLPTRALAAIGAWTSEPLREFIISFDLTRSPIRELKYERDENRMNIILAPTGSSIRREDVEFRAGALRYDLAITLGVGRIEAANANLARTPELLYEKPVINIDAAPANTAYGEVNLLASTDGSNGKTTIPEFTYRILTGLAAFPEDVQTATLLLAGLAAATGNLRLGQASSGAFRMAGELIERGADPEAARRYGGAARPLAEEQLFARAIARTREERAAGTFWSVLTPDDFEKTGTTGEAAAGLLERVADLLPSARRWVLLWQDASSPEVTAVVRSTVPGGYPTTGIGITPSAYPTFRDAEAAISELLRGQDAVE